MRKSPWLKALQGLLHEVAFAGGVLDFPMSMVKTSENILFAKGNKLELRILGKFWKSGRISISNYFSIQGKERFFRLVVGRTAMAQCEYFC